MLGPDTSRRLPSKSNFASDHRGVADAIRSGWADAGICLRLTSVEANLDFLNVRREAYDLCFPTALANDPRIQALIRVVQSKDYRRLVGELPGYDATRTGELQRIDRRDKAKKRSPSSASAD